MHKLSSYSRAALAGLLACGCLLLSACPEPTRSCESDEDCADDERCSYGQCLAATPIADGGAADSGVADSASGDVGSVDHPQADGVIDTDAAIATDSAVLVDGATSCEGVVCDQPPADLCVDAGLVRTYQQAGQCELGQCVYPHQDESCTDCCYGAEINPTGDPIGGGVGYREIFDRAAADWLVTDATALLTALGGATSGEVIYVDDAAIIDLTGHDDIQVPAGVTVASGRGRQGSQGALITTTQFDTFPLFRAAGADVRFTGLRVAGPDPEVGDHDYQNPELSRGIQTGSPGLVVDNCELSGFGHAAVVVYGEEAAGHVHHNYIHHNTRAGLGYGVVLDQSTCLIEANLFDANRHSIAGTGRPGTSYEARYNLVLPHATGHYFDMHGAADFDKRISSAIWRFDEGSGAQASDTSVYNSNHCTLQSMETATCWAPGEIRTGLVFDGQDDHLECGDDPSLQSSTGSIELWIRPDRLGQDQELLELFEDAAQNYLVVSLTAANQVGISIADNGATLLDVVSDQALTAGAMRHVVLTQDGAGVLIYIDGQPVPTSGSDGPAWSDHLALSGTWIGAGQRSAFQGLLDEVRVYSRALEPEEVLRHFNGQADIAGDSILIHHNTFRGGDMSSVVIRGVPAVPSSIHHNWFTDQDVDHAVRQTNAQGNLEVQRNHLGPEVPAGTRLPVAIATATPTAGNAPLEVSFDAAASSFAPDGPEIVAWRWDFGDGEHVWGERVNHTYAAGGCYGVDLTVFDARGATAHQHLAVEVSSGSGYRLSFWVKDSYRGSLTGYYVIQALVDGAVVWEQDVADTPGWRQVSLDIGAELAGQESAELTFKALNRTAVQNGELIELSVYIDDVKLFGGDLDVDGFEGASTWAFRESTSDWSGTVHAEDSRSGWRSFRIHHPYARDCQLGAEASIVQTIPLRSQHLLAEWRLDEGQGDRAEDRSLSGHHGSLKNMSETSWQAGVMGQALSFDGVDDRVECLVSDALRSSQGRIDLWLSAAPGSTGTALSLVADGQSYLAVELEAGGLVRLHLMEGGADTLDLRSLSPVDDGAFHHLALVQDGVGASIYVDGVEGSSGQNGTGWTQGLALTEVRLGDGPQGPLRGVLDEVRLDDRPADAAWALEQYRRGHPLGLWRFDEGAGTTSVDEAGDRDASLQEMDPAVSWVSGVSGAGLWFDGQDDYLSFADGAYLGAAQGSIELWFQADRLDENQDLLNLFEDGYENYLLVRLNQDNRIYLRVEDDDAGLINLTSATAVQSGGFHHLAVTQDGFGARVFMDGVELRCSGDNGPAWTDHLTSTDLWLGRGHWSWFNGAVDELSLHARALRPEEIAARASLLAP